MRVIISKSEPEVNPENGVDAELQKICDFVAENCCYEATSAAKVVWMRTECGKFAPRPLKHAAAAVASECGKMPQEYDFENIICDYAYVDEIHPAGMMLPPGIYTINGRRILSAVDMPSWVDATTPAGEAPEISTENAYCVAITQIFGNAGAGEFFAWLAGARARVREWRSQQETLRDLPALAIVGEQGCGKTLILKRILPAVLGSRGLDISRYLSGASDFTGRIDSTPLLTVDDSLAEAGIKTRKAITKRLKQVLYSDGAEIHVKNRDAITVKIPSVIVMCCNTDASSLRALPVLSQGDEHKMLILKAQSKLEKNESLQEKQEWNRRFEADIQDFINFLDNMADVRDETNTWIDCRQFVRGGCMDAEIKMRIDAVNPAGIVGDAITDAVTKRRRDASMTAPALTGLAVSGILQLMSSYCDPDIYRSFCAACQTQADKREAVTAWLDVRGITGRYDTHSKTTVYDISGVKYEY